MGCPSRGRGIRFDKVRDKVRDKVSAGGGHASTKAPRVGHPPIRSGGAGGSFIRIGILKSQISNLKSPPKHPPCLHCLPPSLVP